MKKDKKYFEQRDIPECSCHNIKFRTVIKKKAYACNACDTVKIVCKGSELSKYDERTIESFRYRSRNAASVQHSIMVQNAVEAEARKNKPKKLKKKFITPKFLRKKNKIPASVINPGMQSSITPPPKTEKSTEKK